MAETSISEEYRLITTFIMCTLLLLKLSSQYNVTVHTTYYRYGLGTVRYIVLHINQRKLTQKHNHSYSKVTQQLIQGS